MNNKEIFSEIKARIPTDFKIIIEYFVKLCKELLTVKHIIPTNKRADIENFVARMTTIVNDRNNFFDFDKEILVDTINYLSEGRVNSYIDEIIHNRMPFFPSFINTIMYYKVWEEYDNLAGMRREKDFGIRLEYLKRVRELYKPIGLLIKHNKDIDIQLKKQNTFELSKSESKSLPESISNRESIRKILKPKKLITQKTIIRRKDEQDNSIEEEIEKVVPDPNEPDEFIEQIFYSEPDTQRTKFRSHEKLSKTSSFKYSDAKELPPLPKKKRTAILQELRNTCNYMKDGITYKRFDRMRKKDLQLIIKIGNKEGQQRCYNARSIYKYWLNFVKEFGDRIIPDPVTKVKITDGEKEEIMKNIKYINPKAINPDTIIDIKKDPYVKLIIQETLGNKNFYEIQVIYQIPNMRFVSLVDNLGVFPKNIEAEDVDGDINLTSDSVASLLITIFDSGRLLANNFIPFRCCRIHLRKTIGWWQNQSGNEPLVKGININKWRGFAQEAYDML